MKLRQPITLRILVIFFHRGFLRLADGAFSTTVESGEEQCYNVIAPMGVQSTIHGNFDILDDESPPDPIGVVLYDSKMVSMRLIYLLMQIALCYFVVCKVLSI